MKSIGVLFARKSMKASESSSPVLITRELLDSILASNMNLQTKVEELEGELKATRDEMAEHFLGLYQDATISNQKLEREQAMASIVNYMRQFPTLTMCEQYLFRTLGLEAQAGGEALCELLNGGVLEYVERANGFFWRLV